MQQVEARNINDNMDNINDRENESNIIDLTQQNALTLHETTTFDEIENNLDPNCPMPLSPLASLERYLIHIIYKQTIVLSLLYLSFLNNVSYLYTPI